jgi:DNA helicase HerA-like ATPase
MAMSKQSVGAIQRSLPSCAQKANFFGEPALDLEDFMKLDESGKGVINILAADKLMSSPRLYSTFLLWLLSELFELLPEVDDPDKPKLAFFFDEAHLLFDDAPSALLEKVEQVVRLIRSKGVGVYFITQNPIDIPDKVAGQLGNRVQHKLNAFTPRDESGEVGRRHLPPQSGNRRRQRHHRIKIGEALVSLLLPDGAPSPVERSLIKPPRSRVGPLTRRSRAISSDRRNRRQYDTLLDRDSAKS